MELAKDLDAKLKAKKIGCYIGHTDKELICNIDIRSLGKQIKDIFVNNTDNDTEFVCIIMYDYPKDTFIVVRPRTFGKNTSFYSENNLKYDKTLNRAIELFEEAYNEMTKNRK